MKQNERHRKATSRDLQAAERREQLLEAAKSLFAEQGYHATSTRSITQKIGMADGLIYHYFPGGKLELLHTIVREGHQKRLALLDEMRQNMNEDATLREALLRFGQALLQNLLSDRDLMRVHLMERSLLGDEEEHFFANSIRERWKWLADFLRERAGRGEIRQMDFQAASLQFISVVGFTVVRELIGINDGLELDLNKDVERLIEFTIEQWLE